MTRYQFTSESVTEGHPDKLCDAISDSVLHAVLAEDPRGRLACETTLAKALAVGSDRTAVRPESLESGP